MSDTRQKILDIAERFIRSGGYNNCSFRDIAAEIGIKSASVHHHFPTKQDLAEAVARRYRERFFTVLGEPGAAAPAVQIKRYCETFHAAYASSGKSCLCGILSNEAELLPLPVRKEVRTFVEANHKWLSVALGGEAVAEEPAQRQKARMIYTGLQGAMAVAAVSEDQTWLDDMVSGIMDNLV